ncbi:DUF452 family protein [Ruegeria sp. R13_0]|uniref:pimeloyl-ACP methyl esterase BioG family protein n=1 Tax=Ruegeria sp. R13_0 TaxID=2821099 RepID=UPI001ADD19D1|nr:pimeloyl-ACP methyl esterase BioG family protein [Ruegeria sp. R13_0]MBO9433112.1 DUF452 family protein [Ruegeria sp. R13_0]
MRHRWLARSDSTDLILVFGGWALGSAPFSCLTGGDNVLFVEDYTGLDDPLPDLSRFDRVDLLAFSFGVASAAHWLNQTGMRPDRLVAVSGTLNPASAEHGIAPDLIRATADQLSQTSFAKFCRRAGVSGEVPELDIPSARAELHAVIDRGPAEDPGFDRIWIPTRDRIVPTNAQQAAWASRADSIRTVEGPHVPFRARQSWAEWLA